MAAASGTAAASTPPPAPSSEELARAVETTSARLDTLTSQLDAYASSQAALMAKLESMTQPLAVAVATQAQAVEQRLAVGDARFSEIMGRVSAGMSEQRLAM